MEQRTKTYIVKSPLNHDLKQYEVGEEIELESTVAIPLMNSKTIEKPKKESKASDPKKPDASTEAAEVPGAPEGDVPPATES